MLGGALITMFGMFIGVVLSNLRYVCLSSTRNIAIIGTSILLGLMIPYWTELQGKELVLTGKQKTMQTRNIVMFSKPYEILSMKYLWPSTINTQNIFFKFYYLTELLGFLVVRPSTFHILIFSSETTGPIATKLW